MVVQIQAEGDAPHLVALARGTHLQAPVFPYSNTDTFYSSVDRSKDSWRFLASLQRFLGKTR